MWHKLQTVFSSVAAKLFLSFWLITLISIISTSFIIHLLEQESKLITANKDDQKKLEQMAKKITKRQPKNLKWLVKSHHGMGEHIWLVKGEDNQLLFQSKRRHTRNLVNYLTKNDLTNLTSVQFPTSRLTGPQQISLNDKNYQLYIAKRTKPADIGSIFMQMPKWVRLIIPLIISLTFCLVLARYLTRPVVAIQQTAKQIGDGEYSARVNQSIDRKDELGQLASSFNTMAEKLENNIGAHQRLLADVSHELRSPLTRLQITLGLIEQQKSQEENISHLVLRCEHEVKALDEMIANVLTVSRQENSFQTLDLADHSLKELFAQLNNDCQLHAQQAHVNIEYIVEENIRLHVDNSLILSAFSNILLNAIKYSSAEQTITIKALKQSNKCIIEFIDQGTGVEEQHLTHLFEAFYRISDARDRNSGGTGLGLAIAKQAIEAHHGKIYAKNNDSGGLTIALELPLN